MLTTGSRLALQIAQLLILRKFLFAFYVGQRLKELELEEKEKERIANLTPEEKLAEKLRLQKIQEENDLRVAMDTFGVSAGASIDGLNPTNRAELTELADAIRQKVSQFKEMEDFAGFLEELTRSICSSREYLAYMPFAWSSTVDCVPNAPRLNSFFFFAISQLPQKIYRESRKPSTLCTPKSKRWKRKRPKRTSKAKRKPAFVWKTTM